ncbi:MAG: membrane protein insertase YidC [Verrucomicrobiae bacterium]|nr:membrane protein insertase YidC [Verrucomicrobiae bacterium]MCP5539295.1 membrane protein insertase YidC [Akkermansiaceae bacterium]
MDRTAWIVVVLCVAGMFGWGALQSRRNAEYQRYVQEQREKEAAEAEKSEASGTGPAGKSAGDVEKAAVEAAPAIPPAEEKTAVLANADLRCTLTSAGGGIRMAEILDHTKVKGEEGAYVTLNERGKHPIGAISTGPGQWDAANWRVTEQTDAAVAFASETAGKLGIEKRFEIAGPQSDEHLVKLTVTIRNNGDKPLSTAGQYLYLGSASALHAGEWPRQTGFFWKEASRGSMEYQGVDRFKKGGVMGIGASQLESQTMAASGLGWAGVSDQYFTTMLKVKDSYDAPMWTARFPFDFEGGGKQPKRKPYAIEAAVGLPEVTLNPGDQRTLAYELYLGPKEYARLKRLGDQTTLVMNYDDTPIFGWMFGWAIKPLASWLIQGLVALKNLLGGIGGRHAYGIAIILITIAIRVLIWPVYAKSTRTMKRMSKLTPLMNELKEKYKDDQQRQSEELMKLYRDYGVNPLGGCLPMFIQMPVFLAFYGMLWRAVELRHESFLWVPDLAMPDTLFQIPGLNIPFNLLPLIMAGTTAIQMALTPKSGDKTQQTMFMLMPLIFLFICYNFASALALYWTTGNIFSIGQTWLMNKLPEPELKKRKGAAGGKKGFFERLQDQAKEQQARAAQSRQAGGSGSGGGSNRLPGERGERHTKSKKRKK